MSVDSIKETKNVGPYFYKPISLTELEELLKKTTPVKDACASVLPQANDLSKIFKILEIANQQKKVTADQVAEKVNMTVRQGHYYSMACVYLNLLEKRKVFNKFNFVLTCSGKTIMGEKHGRKRNLMMIEALIKHHVFHYFVSKSIKTRSVPSTADITKWLINNLSEIDSPTLRRRSSTVRSWVSSVFNDLLFYSFFFYYV